MRGFHLLLACSWLAAVPPAGRPADYAAVGRAIKAEPEYRSKAPRYVLLLFGPEAKLKVWLVLDGRGLYLDRNGDGDLTSEGEHFARAADCKGVELADPDGKTRYTLTGVAEYAGEDPAKSRVLVSVEVRGPAAYRQYGDAAPAGGPRAAPLMHFHGPLTAGPAMANGKVPPGLALAAGGKPTDLRAVVGTMAAEYGCWVVVRSHGGDKPAFPGGGPVADVEFPPKAPGGPAVKRRYRLDQFC